MKRYLLYGFYTSGVLMSAAVGLLIYTAWPDIRTIVSDAANRFLDHRYFSVLEIKVNAGPQTGGSEIVALAGLNHGMSLWRIDPSEIERKIGRHPWIRRVTVRREFPHRVVIQVEERVPKGIVLLGRLYYVDGEGVVFKEVDPKEKPDFPFLTGWGKSELTSPTAQERIREAISLSELVKEVLPLSEIHFSKRGGVILYPAAYPVPIHMGWGDWEEKLRRLEWVLAEWRGREKRLRALDLSFRGQVVAKLRTIEG